jgi:hypothetical protein
MNMLKGLSASRGIQNGFSISQTGNALRKLWSGGRKIANGVKTLDG